MTPPDPLSDLLTRWQPRPSPAPDFAAGVHARLARTTATRTTPPSTLARVLAWPAMLPLAAALAILLGVVSAVSLQRARTQDLMAEAYARSIDPVSLSGHPTVDHAHLPAS